MPRIGRAADVNVLRFVPSSDLANFDPTWTTQYVVRNAAVLVWDMLYGINDRLEPQPQMVEAHEVSADGKTWTFRLRPNLLFHDNTPVLSRDVVASINRWMARDSMGRRLKRQLDVLETVDDRGFRFRLRMPFPKLLYALGKTYSGLFIMPERIARTDPFKQITEHVGSGPMRFRKDEWVPGSRAIFERFAGYQPRPEKANWLAGGKRIGFERIEWKTLPDPATAAAALRNGEVDWWETAATDLVPMLRESAGVAVGIRNPLGSICDLRINHLHPPFNDVRARRALQLVLDQADYMRAAFGDADWQRSASFFIPGTPLYTEQGGEALQGPRDFAKAKRLLAEAGYANEPIVLLAVTDLAIEKAWGDVTADLLKRLGMNVQFNALDWGAVGQRRTRKDKPSQGGWHIFTSSHGGDACMNPAAYSQLDSSGDSAWFGWPNSDAVQAGFARWYDSPDLAAEQQAVIELNRVAMEHVVFVPGGFYKDYQAWRKNVSGIVASPVPLFWDVEKA